MMEASQSKSSHYLQEHFSPAVRETLLFLALFFGIKSALAWILSSSGASLGLSDSLLRQLILENELPFQAFSLFIATYTLDRLHQRPFAERVFGQRWNAHIVGECLNRHLLHGLWSVCGLVALSVFLGFSRLEWPGWDVRGVLMLVPTLIWQAGGVALWVLAMESTRSLLWRLLVKHALHPFEGRLLIVFFDAYLFFRVFCGTPHFGEQIYLALICVALATSLMLWLERGELKGNHLEIRYAAVSRVCLQIGFWLGLVHLFGYPLGGVKAISLINVSDGPLGDPMGDLARQGPAGQFLFVLALIFANNTLLLSVLRQNEKNVSRN